MENLLGVLMVPMVVFMVVVAPSGWCCITAPRDALAPALPMVSVNSCRACWCVPRRCRNGSAPWESILDAEVPGWRNKV